MPDQRERENKADPIHPPLEGEGRSHSDRGGVTKARNPSGPIDRFRRATAQRLRANETKTEERLWKRLHKLPMVGSHFRRQVPLGPYVADFACMAAKLVVELDGSQHALPESIAHDAKRTAWLEAQGFRVLRFWNLDVVQNVDGVVDAIYAAVYGSPSSEIKPLKHTRRPRSVAGAATPPRRASRADPPPTGEGEEP